MLVAVSFILQIGELQMIDFIKQLFEEAGIEQEVITSIFITFAVYILVLSAISLTLYILRAIGVYNMAKNTEIKNPVLAFIPIANCFTFGKLAEKYKKKNGTESAKFGVILLVFNILSIVFTVLFFVFFAVSATKILGFADQAVKNGTEMTIEMFSSIVVPAVLYVALIGLLLAFNIIRYVALWRVFAFFDYNNATAFTIFSVLFSFLDPIFLFILRNKQPMQNYDFFTQNNLSGL